MSELRRIPVTLVREDHQSILLESPTDNYVGALFMLGLMFFFAISIFFIGVSVWVQFPDSSIGVWIGCVFLLLALFFALRVPLKIQVKADESFQELTITKIHLFGFNPWPRTRNRIVKFSEINDICPKSHSNLWGIRDPFVQVNMNNSETPVILQLVKNL